jgi:hypothetical protein
VKIRPKVFIGSSTEGKDIADAIDFGLQGDAESTVWTNGVFRLADSTLNSLMRQVLESDFGVFVFSGDDTAEIRGQLFTIPRDNVIYELGLFSGALGPSRCFYVVPQDQSVHLPSDLLGVTLGKYQRRLDNNWTAALNNFCSDVRYRIQNEGFRDPQREYYLLKLGTRYECCDWIDNENARVEKKDDLWQKMCYYLRGHGDFSKIILLKKQKISNYVAFAAAVTTWPRKSDYNLLLSIDATKVVAAHLQYKLFDAVSAMNSGVLLSLDEKHKLKKWASQMPNMKPHLRGLIEDMRA